MGAVPRKRVAYSLVMTSTSLQPRGREAGGERVGVNGDAGVAVVEVAKVVARQAVLTGDPSSRADDACKLGEHLVLELGAGDVVQHGGRQRCGELAGIPWQCRGAPVTTVTLVPANRFPQRLGETGVEIDHGELIDDAVNDVCGSPWPRADLEDPPAKFDPVEHPRDDLVVDHLGPFPRCRRG